MAITLLLGFLLAAPAAFEQHEPAPELPPLNEVLPGRSFVDYEARTAYRDRIEVFRRALESYRDLTAAELREERHEELSRMLRVIDALAAYAFREPSRRSARPKDLQSNEVKKLEILLRKLVEDVAHMHASAPEAEHEIEQARKSLERLRGQLLEQLFGETLS